jgi:probable HAF family extracellular repeat protein
MRGEEDKMMQTLVVRERAIRALMGALVLLFCATATGWSQTLTWLGTLPNGGRSEAYGVSADGRVVVGKASTALGWGHEWRAFRWTADGGMQNLGTLGGRWSEAWGVSADGRVVVGSATNAAGQDRAFRWTAGEGMVDLGTLTGGSRSWAYGVSADGSVIVGVSTNAGGYERAVRWTPLGIQNLGTADGSSSQAYGVSSDGSIVVGRTGGLAFRWTRSSGMQTLPLPDGYNESVAYGISANGSVIVGSVTRPPGPRGGMPSPEACVWINGVPEILGRGGEVYSVSGDGSVMVGMVIDSQGKKYACRWTASGGLEILNQTYARLMGPDSRLDEARAISPDGRFIVGWGFNENTWRTEAFLLDTRCIPHNGDIDRNGCVDDRDLLTVLFEFGETGYFNGVDTNCDGIIDDADLLEVLFNFGSGC